MRYMSRIKSREVWKYCLMVFFKKKKKINQLFISQRAISSFTTRSGLDLFLHLHCKLKQIRWGTEEAIQKYPPFDCTESWTIMLGWYLA